MGRISAKGGKSVTVALEEGINVVLRPGEDVEEEKVAAHVRAALDDPDSYTSHVLVRSGGKAKAEVKAEAKAAPEAPPEPPTADPGPEAATEPDDAAEADTGAQSAPRRRSRKAD